MFPDYAQLRAQEEAAAQVRGRHYVDWVPVIDEMRAAKRDDEALALLMEIIPATERAAAVTGREPAPAYTGRAAIILRRRKDYLGEIRILERYLAACPPDRHHEGFAERLQKARALAAGSRPATST